MLLTIDPAKNRQRGPATVVVTLVVAGILPVILVAIASTIFYPLTTQRISLEAGHGTFREQCASCHALDSGAANRMGPHLENIGSAASRRRPGMSAVEYIVESIVDPAAFRDPSIVGQMPRYVAADLTENQVRNLVAFLTSQNAHPNYREILTTPVEIKKPPNWESLDIDLARVEEGKSIFRDKGACIISHPLDSSPGFELLAPSILTAGRYDERFLRQSLDEPSHQIAPGYKRVTVILRNGRLHSGRLMSHTSTEVTLLTVNARGQMEPVTIQRNQIEHDANGGPVIKTSEVSSMPPLGSTLTERETEALLEFLRSMREYSPY